MKLSIPSGTTSKRIGIFLQDSSSTTGAGLTGLNQTSASLTCYSWIDTDGNAGGTVQTLASATLGSFTSNGFKEKDATNMPGFYEYGVPNALLAAGVKWAIVMFKGATNLAPMPLEIEVTATSNQDAVRAGLTALPNANAEAAGGLYTRGSGAGQINQAANGQVDTNLARILNTAVSTPATAGILDVNVKNMNNVAATPITTIKAVQGLTTADTIATYTGNTPQTGDGFARLGAPAGASVSADIAAVKVDTAAVKTQTDKLAFTVTNQVDANVLDWKSSTAPAMTGDAFARLGAPAGASVSADVAAVKVDTAAVKAKTDNLPASPAAVGSAMTLTSGERNSTADALLDRADGIETSLTPRGALRLLSAAEAGKLSGAATTTVTIRNVGDSKDRITATVDANGNRSAVTTDAT